MVTKHIMLITIMLHCADKAVTEPGQHNVGRKRSGIMKSTRRLLSIILCLVMCLSLLPTAFAEDGLVSSGKAGPESTFKLYQDGRLIISGTGIV